jgi:hypothetical protein
MSTETGSLHHPQRMCQARKREGAPPLPRPKRGRKKVLAKSTDGPPSTSQPPTMTVYEDANSSMFTDSYEDEKVTANSEVKFVRPGLIQIPIRELTKREKFFFISCKPFNYICVLCRNKREPVCPGILDCLGFKGYRTSPKLLT